MKYKTVKVFLKLLRFECMIQNYFCLTIAQCPTVGFLKNHIVKMIRIQIFTDGRIFVFRKITAVYRSMMMVVCEEENYGWLQNYVFNLIVFGVG